MLGYRLLADALAEAGSLGNQLCEPSVNGRFEVGHSPNVDPSELHATTRSKSCGGHSSNFVMKRPPRNRRARYDPWGTHAEIGRARM